MKKKSKVLNKNKPTKTNANVLENPANDKKLSKVDEKFAAFIRTNGKTPPDSFDADFKAHIFGIGEVNSYVLSKSRPAMGIIGCLNSDDDPKTWTFTKAKDSYQIDVVQAKEVKMLNIFNKARAAALADCDDTESEAFDVVDDEPVGQPDAGQPKEPAEENYETTVSRLAALSDRDYDQARKSAAKEFGVRVSTLDKAVVNEQSNVNALKIMGPRLLTDVYDVVTSLDVQQIGTSKLISELCAGNSTIWSVFNRGSQIDPKTLAHILSLYGVTPRDLRFGDVVLKGYTRSSIVAAYTRYISSAAQPQPDDFSE